MLSISFFVVLLATYCYSVPINGRVDITTPDYEFTTGKTIVDNENKINMHLVTDEESTGLPDIHHEHKSRTTEESNESDVQKEERALPMNDGYRKDYKPIYHTKNHNDNKNNDYQNHHQYRTRNLDETTESNTVMPSSGVHSSFDNFLFTTMETKTEFEKKAFPSHEIEGEEQLSHEERDFHGEEMEHTSTDKDSMFGTSTTDKNVHINEHWGNPEEHTSGDSFGKMTGLLNQKREEEEEKSENKREDEEEKSENKREDEEEKSEDKREEEEKSEDKREEETNFEDRSVEESTTPFANQTTRIVKTETIIPVKITETKIFGQKQPMDKTKKSNN